jgi:hypothetical protein
MCWFHRLKLASRKLSTLGLIKLSRMSTFGVGAESYCQVATGCKTDRNLGVMLCKTDRNLGVMLLEIAGNPTVGFA